VVPHEVPRVFRELVVSNGGENWTENYRGPSHLNSRGGSPKKEEKVAGTLGGAQRNVVQCLGGKRGYSRGEESEAAESLSATNIGGKQG